MRERGPVTMFSSKIKKVDILQRLVQVVPRRSFVCFNSSGGTPCKAGRGRGIQSLAVKYTQGLFSRKTGNLIITYGATADTTIQGLHRVCPCVPVIKVRPTLGPTTLYVRRPGILIVTAPVAVRRRGFRILVRHCGRGTRVLPLPYPKLVSFVRQKSLSKRSLCGCLRSLLCSCQRGRISTTMLNYARCPFTEGRVRRILKRGIGVFSKNRKATHRVGEELRRGSLLYNQRGHKRIMFRGDLASSDGVRLYGGLLGVWGISGVFKV